MEKGIFDTAIFDPATLPLYLVGFISFVISLIDDFVNPQRKRQTFLYYLQEFLYTLLAIALGISVCYAFDTSKSVAWITSIIMGICGSSVLRKIKSKKHVIGEKIVDKIEDKITNS